MVKDLNVSIQHIIGTLVLIGLVISASLAYNIITSYMQNSIIVQQLQQVSEIVALNLVEIVNLANFANFGNLTRNDTLTRTIDLPLDVSGRAYAVRLTSATDQSQGYNVTSYLLSDINTVAASRIPINSTASLVQFATDDTRPQTMYWVGSGEAIVSSVSVIYGGSSGTVVWAWRGNGDTTVAGLGRLVLSG